MEGDQRIRLIGGAQELVSSVAAHVMQCHVICVMYRVPFI